jgi:hypothetical protein
MGSTFSFLKKRIKVNRRTIEKIEVKPQILSQSYILTPVELS